MAQLDKRMELRLDQLLQLLRRERGEFWVSSQQLWGSINHSYCISQTGQHWARMVWCSGRRTISLTWVLRRQQARYFVQKARKVFWCRILYILHRIYNPVDDISFYKQYIISPTRKDSISSTLKPGRGLREPSMDRGNKVGNLTLYTCDVWPRVQPEAKVNKIKPYKWKFAFCSKLQLKSTEQVDFFWCTAKSKGGQNYTFVNGLGFLFSKLDLNQVDLSLVYSQKQVSTPRSSRARRCQSEDRSVVRFLSSYCTIIIIFIFIKIIKIKINIYWNLWCHVINISNNTSLTAFEAFPHVRWLG